MDALDATPLCPSPLELRLHQITYREGTLEVTAAGCRRVVACPHCGHATTRIHSRYRRRLADLPWHGLRVHLVLTVRRFFCDLPRCPRHIFTERFAITAPACARKTARAAAALDAIGFAVGGRPGARLAQALGLAASAATIIAQLRQGKDPVHATPHVLGVDDWAMRRRQRHGTILLDLERHRVIEVTTLRQAAKRGHIDQALFLVSEPGRGGHALTLFVFVPPGLLEHGTPQEVYAWLHGAGPRATRIGDGKRERVNKRRGLRTPR